MEGKKLSSLYKSNSPKIPSNLYFMVEIIHIVQKRIPLYILSFRNFQYSKKEYSSNLFIIYKVLYEIHPFLLFITSDSRHTYFINPIFQKSALFPLFLSLEHTLRTELKYPQKHDRDASINFAYFLPPINYALKNNSPFFFRWTNKSMPSSNLEGTLSDRLGMGRPREWV